MLELRLGWLCAGVSGWVWSVGFEWVWGWQSLGDGRCTEGEAEEADLGVHGLWPLWGPGHSCHHLVHLGQVCPSIMHEAGSQTLWDSCCHSTCLPGSTLWGPAPLVVSVDLVQECRVCPVAPAHS